VSGKEAVIGCDATSSMAVGSGELGTSGVCGGKRWVERDMDELGI